MQGHRQLVTVNRNRLENPADFPKIKANSFIVAPFRSRQLDYMIFACPPKQQTELMSYVADIPYLQSPPPAPGNIRNNSEEHQKLIESKLEGFDLFQTRPQEVLGFLEPLYSTACGAITAAIADSMDSATHYVIWTSPNLNSYPIQVQFRIPIKKKTGWAVGHTIRGAYEADLLDGQISKIQMGNGFLTVTAKLSTGSGVRFRTYLINSRNRRISVGTTLYTVEERANPVLKMLEGAKLSDLFHTNTTGWISARALLAGDVEVAGIDAPEQTSISVDVAGTQVHLNEDQEAVLKGEKILVAAVQNSALDVIGSKIAQLQSNQIRPVRYVNDLMANDPSNASPFALQVRKRTSVHSEHHIPSTRRNDEVKLRPLLRRLRMPNPAIPIAFVDVPSQSVKSVTGSHSNVVEANTDTAVTVGTVDSAQGSERSVVILCTTRTSLEQGSKAASFSDAKRLNVALSRAKDGMFVTGSIKCLQDAATWSAIVAWCKDRNLVTDLHFFDNSMRTLLQL
ncbi:hypothetical protein ANCCAN_11247 [Ancylostoma caninum]|uniref:DNA2/NAM7 helicase-like C-terminal domain-containing protein n=1 Tax=Ancylostoma caninum TaxID=29170 RepID=A0A368GEE1_ANCCA|nr:hypothetical protein ANCCAN_11247 [Ancylostoma caninum]